MGRNLLSEADQAEAIKLIDKLQAEVMELRSRINLLENKGLEKKVMMPGGPKPFYLDN